MKTQTKTGAAARRADTLQGSGRERPATQRQAHRGRRHGRFSLTKRELEVLALLCEGLSNKEIGRRLNIAAQTVKVHVGNILQALDVSTRLQAVLRARCWELVDRAGKQSQRPHVVVHREDD